MELPVWNLGKLQRNILNDIIQKAQSYQMLPKIPQANTKKYTVYDTSSHCGRIIYVHRRKIYVHCCRNIYFSFHNNNNTGTQTVLYSPWSNISSLRSIKSALFSICLLLKASFGDFTRTSNLRRKPQYYNHYEALTMCAHADIE